MTNAIGCVALFGSGETSHSGGQVFEALARALPAPLRVAVLETPAGFELNSAQVAGRVADFIRGRLQNYCPQVTVIPARKRHTPFSPDNPTVIEPLLHADMIFLGPGSPTYAVRQLKDSLAWHTLIARHRLGATIVLASAAVIAASARALPVYEIYKVGEEPHWHAGLDLFGAYGLSLIFIPHWNNAEGGAELDTSHCFMGQERFTQLMAQLPPHMVIVGIDEHTALVLDLQTATCQVMGRGNITLLKQGDKKCFSAGQTCSIHELGPFRLPDPSADIPPTIWRAAVEASLAPPPTVPEQVMALVAERQAARARRDWAAADALRRQVEACGWRIKDTPAGPLVEKI